MCKSVSIEAFVVALLSIEELKKEKEKVDVCNFLQINEAIEIAKKIRNNDHFINSFNVNITQQSFRQLKNSDLVSFTDNGFVKLHENKTSLDLLKYSLQIFEEQEFFDIVQVVK